MSKTLRYYTVEVKDEKQEVVWAAKFAMPFSPEEYVGDPSLLFSAKLVQICSRAVLKK